MAESTGLIVPLGAWVIRQACEEGQRLHDAGLHLSMSVNLSAKQLNDRQTAVAVEEALTATGFLAGSLILEVTETTMIDDTDSALHALRAIKALGVQIAVDDFGTGYSSLAYLKRYPVDGIKIDRSFVQDMVANPDDRAIVASLIKLARDLDLWVIAEGVETLDELDQLRAMDCELVQGYLFARPVQAGEVVALTHRLATHPAVRPPGPRGRHGTPTRVIDVDAAAQLRPSAHESGCASGPAAAHPLRPVHRLPLRLLGGPQPGVGAAGLVGELALQVAPGVDARRRQVARVDARLHRAAGLADVRAVGEAARRGELLDVGERLGQARLRRRPARRRAGPGCRRRPRPDGSTTQLAVASWCAGPCRRPARIVAGGHDVPPASALTSVDLPAPEAPSSTSVVPGRGVRRQRTDVAGRRADGDDVGAGRVRQQRRAPPPPGRRAGRPW